ncbi:Nucleoporin nup84 [Coemansia sp. RSA 1933]|nr:Nucleoporin nup84 [Coemansia sp. RSA 1933]
MVQVFDSLTEIDSTVLRESAKQPFHLLQRSLITDGFANYVADYARKLRADNMGDGERNLLRFVVHASLYLSGLGVALPNDAVESVLQAYIGILSKNHSDLVAVYTTYLPKESQTESYALFLCGIKAPVNTKLQLLRLAERHGLDMDAICKRTTQLVFDIGKVDDSNDMSDGAGASFELAEPVEAITNEEDDMIRAIEWVTSNAKLYDHALIEVCRLVRRFLLRGRTNAATRLFNSLPDDFVQQDWVKEAEADTVSSSVASHFQEYIHLLSLCDAYAYYATWSESLCKRPIDPRIQSSRRQALWLEWKENITVATERASQMFRNRILDVDWLGSPLGLDNAAAYDTDSSNSSDHALLLQDRAQELECLRELYIPETVFRLHSILFETRDALPKNLKRSLDLAQLVADESLRIYHHLANASPSHPQGRLPSFMGLMRRSAFEILRVQQESQPDKPPLMIDSAASSSSVV